MKVLKLIKHQLVILILCFGLWTSGVEAQLDPETQAEKKVFNPADVTAAASHIEVVPEYNNGDEVSAPLLRLIYDIDWAEGKYSITTELPYGQVDFDDGKSETGLGDIRLLYFQRVHQAKDPEASIQNMVFSLDVFQLGGAQQHPIFTRPSRHEGSR